METVDRLERLSSHKSPKWFELCEIVGVGGLSALYGVPNPMKKGSFLRVLSPREHA